MEAASLEDSDGLRHNHTLRTYLHDLLRMVGGELIVASNRNGPHSH
jgi:hypothetical protein